jgi:hypothetical protein
MVKGDKKANRANEVLTIEATINMHKRLHGMYVGVFCFDVLRLVVVGCRSLLFYRLELWIANA